MDQEKSQLIMYWKNNGEPAPEIKLPLNCSIVAFPQLKDAVNKWLDIMQYGLTNGVQKPELSTEGFKERWENIFKKIQ